MESSSRVLLVLFFFVSLNLSATEARAQDDPVKIGIGFDAILQPDEGLGLGVRTRFSKPLSWDISVALDIGLSGFILEGRDDASYAFDPQLSLIVTFPNLDRATYLLGGFGVYVPFGDASNSSGGPTVHIGIGRALPLRESTFYYEVDPALIVQKSRVVVSIPFRIGIIL